MEFSEQSSCPEEKTSHTITSTLFELIEALHAAVEPWEDDLVVLAVAHLLYSGHVRFLGESD